MNLNETIDKKNEAVVKIDGLSFFEGQGVGRSQDGKVHFVEDTCPGDLVKVLPIKVKKNFNTSKVIEILEPSPHRTEPKCKDFLSCGGCSIQHTSYKIQLQEKNKVLQRYLSRMERLEALDNFEPTENEYHYRTRIEIHIKNKKWGFFKKKSHQLVQPSKCEIVTPEVLQQLYTLPNLKDGHYHTDKDGPKLRARGNSGVFEQINPPVSQKIKEYILLLIQKRFENIDTVYDLYSGSGNYSLFLAPHLESLEFIAVEISEYLVKHGKLKSERLKNLLWHHEDVSNYLEKLDNKSFNQSLFILNPPRVGLSPKTLQNILKKHPREIIYVSCNPMTLFRDIDAMSPMYRLEIMKGFDMFPQTMHFETVALLTLK